MRIAIVSNTSWNILNFRLGLIQFLQSKGYDVFYIAPYDDSVEKIAKISDVKYLPLEKLQRKGYNPFADISLTQELYKYYKKEKIDIALSYTIKPNIYSSIAGYLCKTKTIANITGLGFVFLKKNMGNLIAKQILRFSLALSSKIVFQNQTDKTLFEQKKVANPEKTFLINGSGINTSHYLPNVECKQDSSFVFLFIGRLLYDKGIREFINASKKLSEEFPSLKFHLVGALDEGNPSAVSKVQLEQWLSENSKLEYFGNQSDVRPYINGCDAVVLPSYREGIPRVLLESMALEKPFVTVKSPGCQDVTIDGENGLLAEVESDTSLYEMMKKMSLLDSSKREEMGKNGRKLVLEKYDEKIVVEEYLKLILSLT